MVSPSKQSGPAAHIEALSAEKAKRLSSEIDVVLREFSPEREKLMAMVSGLDTETLRKAVAAAAKSGGSDGQLEAVAEPARRALAEAATQMGLDDDTLGDRLVKAVGGAADEFIPDAGGSWSTGQRRSLATYVDFEANQPPTK
jgi:hypothetical protein